MTQKPIVFFLLFHSAASRVPWTQRVISESRRVSADPGEPHIKLLPPPCGKTELLFALLRNQSDVEFDVIV